VEVTERLAHQAGHDALTGLANRTLLLEELAQALARPERAARSCALLLLDLDKFKLVNDNFGHPVGDEVLVATAERLKMAVRPGDRVARLGGDESAVIAEGIADERAASNLAERLVRSLSRPVPLRGRSVALGCSVGVALSGHTSPQSLLQEADIAMTRAKERGPGRYEIYDQAMRSAARLRLKEEEALRAARQPAGFSWCPPTTVPI
jgi:diguanylate cyclase (GGDEF)-like protein